MEFSKILKGRMSGPPKILWKPKDVSPKIQPPKSGEKFQHINFRHFRPWTLSHVSEIGQNHKGGMSAPPKILWKHKDMSPKIQPPKSGEKFQRINFRHFRPCTLSHVREIDQNHKGWMTAPSKIYFENIRMCHTKSSWQRTNEIPTHILSTFQALSFVPFY